MILNCPHCDARFLVADRLIPAEGRTVRCGACSNQWHVNNPAGPDTDDFKKVLAEELAEEQAVAEAIAAKADAPATSRIPTPNVPALTKRQIPLRPLKIALPVLVGLWALLAVMTYFPRWTETPAIRSIYSVFGIHSTAGLAFADVKMEREIAETKTRFVLSGNIMNHANVAREVPVVNVALKDKRAKAIWTRAYPVHITLKPGESYPFRIVNVETSFADAVSTITLDLGNSLQLMNR